MNDHDEEKTTERNLFVRSGKSEAELELGVLYSVEASRGLSATAELLVQCLPVIIFFYCNRWMSWVTKFPLSCIVGLYRITYI